MSTLLEKSIATLVAVHVGDTAGARFEKTYRPRDIAKDFKDNGGKLVMLDYDNPWGVEEGDRNGLRLPAGRPTDDSDQTADLAYSLITCSGLDPAHLREALRESVVEGKSRLWEGQATGAGKTTKNMLSDQPRTTKLYGVPIGNIGSNGSLMRSAPMSLWLSGGIWPEYPPQNGNRLPAYKSLVYQMSEVTHTHPISKQACWIYTLVLSLLLQGGGRENLMGGLCGLDSSLQSDPLFNRLSWTLGDLNKFPYDPGEWPMRGEAEFSLYVALYTLLHTNSFREGIEFAVGVGGDTDTYGAIAGGLLGAYYGYEAIPEDWRETILGHDQMVEYAEKLYAMRVET